MKMSRLWRVVLVLLFLLLVRIAFSIRNQYAFEDWLAASYITFDDFPDSYSKALIAAMAEGKQPQYDYSSFPALNATLHIPPTIHFIWFKDLYKTRPGATQIAAMGSEAPRYCRETNPDFTINVWNATAARDLMERHYAWFLPTYDSYRHPIQRVDAFKYFVLLHYGGVYMDMDIACRRSLIPLLSYPSWFPKASPFGVNNDLMASRAGHPIIKMMTEQLNPRNFNLLFPWVTIFFSTGPQFTSDVVKMWFHELTEKTFMRRSNKTLSSPDDVYVLPQEFYSEEYTFFGHSPGGTWYEGDVFVILWLLARPWTFFVFVAIILLLPLVLYIVLRRRRIRKAVYAHFKSRV